MTMHILIHTDSHINTDTHTHTHTDYRNTPSCWFIHLYACVYFHEHTICVYTQTDTHTLTHTHTHTHMHTHIQTHTHTKTHM